MQINEYGMIVGSKAIFYTTDKVLVCREGAKLRPWIHWGLPGGKLDKGEDMVVGMRRECLEEVPSVKRFLDAYVYMFNICQPDADGCVTYLTNIFAFEISDADMMAIVKEHLNENTEILVTSRFFADCSTLTLRQLAVFNEIKGFDKPFSVDAKYMNPKFIDFDTYKKLKVIMKPEVSKLSKWMVVDPDR